ncbi:MAG: flagellar basal body-associated FliL family protein [Acidocella sp.]|nr:flagellar basal body-associated FliL family protein [Acidocella sp.]
MASKKLYIVISIVVIVATGGIGGTFAAFKFISYKNAGSTVASAVIVPPKPIFFTDVMDVTVSIPPEQNAPPTSFVQVGLQFSTSDPEAIVSYGELQPIIKAAIISILMTQTTNALADPKARAVLIKSCLDISNNVLEKNSNFKAIPPFSAAYITNLVVQE